MAKESKLTERNASAIDADSLMIVIGAIGIALPFVLAIGTVLLGYLELDTVSAASSISGYYYTGMGNVFVGSLCAIGVCLGAYCGYEAKDRIAGNFASVFAIGVALFPTSPDLGATAQQVYISWVHYLCAAALFLTLAYFCLALFTMTHPTGTPKPRGPLTNEKKKENTVYKISGWTILGCVALIGICHFVFLNDKSPLDSEFIKGLYPVYWLEAIAVVAFGFSWLTKSKTVFGENK